MRALGFRMHNNVRNPVMRWRPTNLLIRISHRMNDICMQIIHGHSSDLRRRPFRITPSSQSQDERTESRKWQIDTSTCSLRFCSSNTSSCVYEYFNGHAYLNPFDIRQIYSRQIFGRKHVLPVFAFALINLHENNPSRCVDVCNAHTYTVQNNSLV